MRFENGEERVMDLKKVEPEGDEFSEPQPGDKVCCNVAGARYGAVILQVRRCILTAMHVE